MDPVNDPERRKATERQTSLPLLSYVCPSCGWVWTDRQGLGDKPYTSCFFCDADMQARLPMVPQ